MTRVVSPDELCLDTENPRFAGRKWGKDLSEPDVIQHLLEHADLRELIQSIAANGYLDFEPLVVLPRKTGKRHVVVEGNRRLATVRLLTNLDLAGELDVQLPPMTKEAHRTLSEITVLEVPSRDRARQYVGFKHINGTHKWDSLAKGRFAANWYLAEQKNGITLRDIARRLGDRHDTVLRLVNGIFVLDQAEDENIFRIEDRYPERPFAFSHLYTALARPQYRDYLGLDPQWRAAEPQRNPVLCRKGADLNAVRSRTLGSKLCNFSKSGGEIRRFVGHGRG